MTMIERISFSDEIEYKAIEGAIHIDRYMLAKDFCRGKRVLDAACGEGYGSYLLSRWGAAEVVGLDISKDAVARATGNFGSDKVHFSCKNIEDLRQFASHSFDMAISLETIEHLANPRVFLREIKRVVKLDGIIIISCPNDHWYYPGEDEKNPYHHRKYTLQEFQDMAIEELGEYSHFFLGTPVAGFINVPSHYNQRKIRDSQLRMLNYREDIHNILLPSDHVISGRNASYFVGIWGAFGQQLRENAVLYATGMDWFEKYKKSADADITKLQLEKTELKELYQNVSSENQRLLENTEGINQYLVENREGIKAENDFLKQCNRRLLDEKKEFEQERSLYEQEKAKMEQVKRQLDEILYSHGYAVLVRYYKFKDWLKNLIK